jgi:hypothetical protein
MRTPPLSRIRYETGMARAPLQTSRHEPRFG